MTQNTKTRQISTQSQIPTMTDTSAAMVTTPVEPGSIDTTQPPYYYPRVVDAAIKARSIVKWGRESFD